MKKSKLVIVNYTKTEKTPKIIYASVNGTYCEITSGIRYIIPDFLAKALKESYWLDYSYSDNGDGVEVTNTTKVKSAVAIEPLDDEYQDPAAALEFVRKCKDLPVGDENYGIEIGASSLENNFDAINEIDAEDNKLRELEAENDRRIKRERIKELEEANKKARKK